MHNTEFHLLRNNYYHITSPFMHNLKSNFDKFLSITKSSFKNVATADGNFSFYPRKPKLSDCEIIALSLSAEAIGVDSESYLFGKLNADHLSDFPSLPQRCNYNRRRRKLSPYISQLAHNLSGRMNEHEEIFIVDSIPVPVAPAVARLLPSDSYL